MTRVAGPNGLVFDIEEKTARSLINGGHVTEVDAKEAADAVPDEAVDAQAPEAPAGGSEDPAPGAEDPAPAPRASRQTWVDWALSQGYAEEQLEGLTKAEIRDLLA